jgi:hypothetical protein
LFRRGFSPRIAIFVRALNDNTALFRAPASVNMFL